MSTIRAWTWERWLDLMDLLQPHLLRQLMVYDGVPLRAEFAAGRRITESRDIPLTPQELHALATRLANDVRAGSSAELKGDAGRYIGQAVGGERRGSARSGPETGA